METSSSYTLMNDRSDDALASARDSIVMRGFRPVSVTNPTVEDCSDDSSPEERESSPGAVVRSPRRSILKKSSLRKPENEGENSTSSKSNRVLFSEETSINHVSDGKIPEQIGSSSDLNPNSSLRLLPGKHRPPLKRLKSQLNFDDLGKNEVELKANLFFHIGNPIKRWKIERVIPVKLILQLVKTLGLIIQVYLFTSTIANQRTEFFYNSREVFENLFFKDFEGNPRGVYTVFSIQELFDRFDFICDNYYKLPNITIGGYDFKLENGSPVPVQFKLRQYSSLKLNASTFEYVLNGELNTIEYTVTQDESATMKYINISSDSFFNRFFDLVVSFPINNVRIANRNRAECFTFMITITFESQFDSGKIQYYLRETHEEEPCNGNVTSISMTLKAGIIGKTLLDIFMILLSLLSIFLICTTLKRAIKLARAMGIFYRDQLQLKLSWWDRRPLFPAWHFLNFTSDLIIISGTLYKILLDYHVVFFSGPTRVLLGTAVMLQAGVVLRYVSYFKKFNALNRTLYLAFPELLKFLLCAGLLFLAFSLTGFIVLGPFHPKFITFYETIETLFCLLNGDDMYTTFDQIDRDDDMVAYLYSRFFLYFFLVLFIYFVLNLFTSLVITAYEASQNMDSGMKNEVRRFVFSGPLTPNGVALRDVTKTKKYVDPQVILKRKEKSKEDRRRRYSIIDALNSAA